GTGGLGLRGEAQPAVRHEDVTRRHVATVLREAAALEQHAVQRRLVRAEVDQGHQANSKRNSISTGESSGSTATPTALRACCPASPKISPSSSEAPLITPGW